jgi:hypothetical protein
MKETIKVFKFNGADVPMRSADGEIFVNLTQVAKRFPDKNLSQIINSQEIKDYCDALLKLKNCSLKDKSEIRFYSSADLLIVRKGGINGGGTWAQRKVAIRVAQKLSPELAVWIDAKIEEVLFGAKNNADKGLFDTFANTFATDEQTVAAELHNSTSENLSVMLHLMRYMTQTMQQCAATNALLADRVNDIASTQHTMQSQLNDIHSQLCGNNTAADNKDEKPAYKVEITTPISYEQKEYYSLTECSHILRFHSAGEFLKMLKTQGFVYYCHGNYNVSEKYRDARLLQIHHARDHKKQTNAARNTCRFGVFS